MRGTAPDFIIPYQIKIEMKAAEAKMRVNCVPLCSRLSSAKPHQMKGNKG